MTAFPHDASHRDAGTLAARIALDHERGRLKDARGHQIHTILAAVYLLLLPLATAPKDIAFGLLLVWTLVRLPHTWRSYRATWRPPINWALLAWAAWEAASLLWSDDRKQGFDELGAYRALITPALLWPVIERGPWLIASFIAGVLLQNGAQLLQALEWLDVRPQEGEGRYGGLIHPIHTGIFCVAAMCWTLSALLRARSAATRAVAVIVLAVVFAGLIATEARGPWLAAIVAMPLMLVVTLLRRPALRRVAAVTTCAALLGVGAAWPLLHHRIADRIGAAVSEAREARENHVYWTSVGLRIGMTRWAWDMFQEHPVIGIGAGDYIEAQAADSDYQAALQRAPSQKKRAYMTKSHPHSLYLYTLACNGLVGAAVLAFVLLTVLWRAWIDPPDHLFAEGSFFALLAWFIGAQSDTYNINGHTLGLLMFIVALTLPYRPPLRLIVAAANGLGGKEPRQA